MRIKRGLSRPFGLQENRLGPRRDVREDVLRGLLEQTRTPTPKALVVDDRALALPLALAGSVGFQAHVHVASL